MGLYVGDSDNLVLYLGANEVSAAYLGDTQVYPMSPFAVSPGRLSFTSLTLTANLRIKSPEAWTITDNSGGWLSYSASSGTAGVTVVTVTATAPSADRTATITVTTANYSKTVAVSQIYNIGFYIENRYAGANTLSMEAVSGKTIQYSTDNGATWTTMTVGANSIPVAQGARVYFQGDLGSDFVMPKFNCTNDWAMIGEVAALHNYNWTTTSGGIENYWKNNTTLKEAVLDMSTLTTITSRWNSIFQGSAVTNVDIDLSSLTQAVRFEGMANDCDWMTDFHLDVRSYVNATPNGILAGITNNSQRVTSITIDFAPNTQFTDWGMSGSFADCPSLTTTPDLRNITRAVNGSTYYLFRNCTSLNTVIAPNLANWNEDGYSYNFQNWLYGVAPTGIVVINPNTINVPLNSPNGIPSGWTRVDSYYSVTLDATNGNAMDYATSDGRSGSVTAGNTATVRLDYPQTLSITTGGTTDHLYINGVDQGNGPSYTLDYLDLANGDTLTVVHTNEPS